VELTRRQVEVVAALLDLYWEGGQRPIAYRDVAERLGVGPSTAYRMLRIAERMGYVEALYAARPDAHSVGRSAVLFQPTDLAERTIAAVGRPSPPEEAWEETSARLLEALIEPAGAADEAAIRELLAGLEEPGTPIDVAGRTIAALMVSLEEARGGQDDSELLDRIARGGTRVGLSTLGGMLLGLAWADRTTTSLARRFDRRVETFEAALAELSPAQSRSVAGFAGQLQAALRARRHRLGHHGRHSHE
jgi:DNA-binding MarR family transcriptional regulator